MSNYQTLETSSSSSTSSLSLSSACSTTTTLSSTTLSSQIVGKSTNNNNDVNRLTGKIKQSHSKNSNETNKSALLNKTNVKNLNLSSSDKNNKFSNGTLGNAPQSLNDIDRPPHSYIALISMAILTKNDRKILLNEIYDWVIQNFPYYQHRTDKSWRNSIRHNLSLNECFIKVGKAGNGRGYYWSIHSANINDFKKGDFRRRQARLRAKHDKTSPGAITSSTSESASNSINHSKSSTKQHQNGSNSLKTTVNWPISSNISNTVNANNNSLTCLNNLNDNKLNGYNNYNIGDNINQYSNHQQSQNSPMCQVQNVITENISEMQKSAFNNNINYALNSRSYVDQYSNTNLVQNNYCQLIPTGRDLGHSYPYISNNQNASCSNSQYVFSNNHLNQLNTNNNFNNNAHIKTEPKQSGDSNTLSTNRSDAYMQTQVNNSISVAKTPTGLSTPSSLPASPSSGAISSSNLSSLPHQTSTIYNFNLLNNFNNNNNNLSNSISYNNSSNSLSLLSSGSPPTSTLSTSPSNNQQYNYINSTFPWHSIQTQSANSNILDNFSATNGGLSYNPHHHVYSSHTASNDSNSESVLEYGGSHHYHPLMNNQPQIISSTNNQHIFQSTYTMK